MASSDSAPQLAILKRDKRQVATQIKNDLSRPSSQQQLYEILNYLLDPEKPIGFEAIDWCKFLISGGVPFTEYAANVRQYDNEKVCGLVWTANFIAYRCRTCGISPCMSLCPDCFYGADHTGHDFNMFRSHAGGACDCGDENVMKPEGFCTKHGKKERTAKSVPQEMTSVAKIVIPKLITRFVYYLRNKHQEWVTGSESFNLDDGEHLLGVFHELTGLGASVRAILTQALVDTATYTHEFINSISDESRSSLSPARVHCQEQYMQAKAQLPAPCPKFYRVKVCGKSSNGALPVRTHRRCSYECMQSAVNNINVSDELSHKFALSEILFWTVKYEFPEKITTWLLGLLPDDMFKEEFTKTFVDHYTRISTSLTQCRGNEQRQRVSNKVVHVSVQLFSNEIYAIRMSSERQLLTRMVISLYNMLSLNLIQSNMTSVKINTHQVLNCSNEIIKDHCFWPLISDLVNIISHKPVAMMFMEDSILLDVWFELISFLQGMNLNERELVQHVEFETDTYYASFSAEFEISCSPLWRLLLHCTDSTSNTHVVFVLRKAMEALNIWFESVGITSHAGSSKVNEYQVSFHLPLHRYFAAFLCSAINNKGICPGEELPKEFLKLVMIHPLQIQVAFYEVFAQMWVRNGLQIRGQAMTYTQCHFCNSLVDLDLYLLQVCAAYLNADYFLNSVLKSFHIEHWNTAVEATTQRENIEPGQDDAMLEGCLTMLAMLLSIRTYSGQSADDILHSEIVTLLCMSDRTYSQLCEYTPEKSGTNNPPADLKQYLRKVADFKAPGFNISGKLQQGTYCPKAEVWLQEFDPLHTILRTVHRREFQQSMDRYAEFVQRTNAFPQGRTPWPPLRIPKKPVEPYLGIYNLLRCKSFLNLCLTLLHKKLNSKIHTVTDTALYLLIFLIQMIVTENKPDTKLIISNEHKWFSHDTVLDNLTQHIGTVTVQLPPGCKREKEATLSPDSMDTEDAAIANNLQDMFSIGHNYQEDSVQSASHMRLQRARGSTPGAITSPAPVVPVQSSSSTTMARQVDVTINESIVSLLIKLHNKLSDQDGSYTPLSIRGEMFDDKDMVGDGPFFVARVLDSLCAKDVKYSTAVEKVYKDLLPKASADANSSSAKKKKRAQDRQKKMMEKMAKMQNKFMDKIEKTMSKEEFEKLTETESQDNYVVIEHYECAICSSTTPSTAERPMGMVSLMQSTCVLNFSRADTEPDKLPLTADEGLREEVIFSTSFNRISEKLNRLFKDPNGSAPALGMERSSGVFIQSCGHYLHLDCYKAYQESVSSQSRNRQNLSTDEYYCPLCRQLADVILPILPTGSDTPMIVVPPDDHLQCIKDIGAMLQQKPALWVTGAYSEGLSSVIHHLISNVPSALQDTLSADNPQLSHFLYSIARCNLDYALMYEKNSIIVPSRKSSIAPLLTTLSHYIKKSKIAEGQMSECLDILSQLTGVNLEMSVPNTVVVHHGVAPLLLRDPITVFMQLYANMPPHLASGYLERLISAVYNLAYVQALFHVSCKFNEEERESWITRAQSAARKSSAAGSSRRGSVTLSPTGSLLYTIIKQLTTIRFYPSEDATVAFLECSVWSPQSIESFIQNRCVQFLEFAAVLKKHVYDTPLPERRASSAGTGAATSSAMPEDCHEWFGVLCRHLGLIKTQSLTDSPSEQALNWLSQDQHSIVKGWLNFVMTCKDRPTVRSLIMEKQTWYMPRLLELPTQYDTIFKHYRNRKCPQCSRLPAAPSVCLICGTFICFKEVCCVAHSGVAHAKKCGSGTSVILDINASIVAIIRGKRATLWGSVYLDEHGEEDRDLKRGKPLYLCKDRYRMLEQQWLSHNFDYVCKRWIFHAEQL